MTGIAFDFRIEKATPEGRYVSGWLSVIEKDGKRVEDSQGDLIAMTELRKGMHGYMSGDRIIKAHHKGDGIGRMIEMVIVDDDFVKAMGATTNKRGAWGTAEITDANVQKAVRENKFSGFSMSGKGKRVPVVKARGIPRLGGKGLIPKGEGPRRRAKENAQDNKVYWGSRAFRVGARGLKGVSELYSGRRRKFERIEQRLSVRKSAGYFDRFL